MRPKDIALLLREIILDKNPPTIFLWGGPGIGKSTVVAEVARDAGIGFCDQRLALMDPTDLRGVVIPENRKAVWLPPESLPSDGEGILLLDELTLAPPLVQSSAYQLIQDKRLGEYILPKGWRIIAASNRAEHGANVFKMAYPLRNRFTHIEFDVNVDDWKEWAVKNGIQEEIIEFILFRPDLLYKFDPKLNEDAFASPRSWTACSNLLRLKEKISKNILQESIEGTIGKGVAAEFFGYLEIRKQLPSIEKILAGENFVPDRIDVACAIVIALAMRARTEQFGHLVEYLNYLPADAAALLAKMLLTRDKATVLRTSGWKDFANSHAELLSD